MSTIAFAHRAIVVLGIIGAARTENILVANQPLSISHLRLQHRIIDKLVQRGHSVTELKWAISEQVRGCVLYGVDSRARLGHV